MAIYDRWHLSHPPEGATPCRCGRGKNKQYPSGDHGCARRWQVRYRDEAGDQKKRNFTERHGDNPDVHAEAFDAKITRELHTGTYIDPDAGKVTLEDYARRWRSGLTIDPGTLMQIDSRLGKWVYGTPFGRQEMRALAKSPSLVQSWIKGMERHLEASTIRGIVGWVSTIFEVAMVDGVVGRNPVRTPAVRPPSLPQRRVTPWTLDQVEAAAADVPARLAALPDLCVGGALRQGEVFGLAKEDLQLMLHVQRQVRLIDGQLVFAPPKGGKLRDIPLSDHVRARAREHMRLFPPVAVTLPWVRPDAKKKVTAHLLFTTEAGEALNRTRFNREVWRPARAAAGLPATRDNGLHVLRHTAASAWLAEGVDINTVAEWLGHADPGFTLRTYVHLMPNAADRGRRAMDAFFTRAPGGEQSALDVPSQGVQ
jgi:integrase